MAARDQQQSAFPGIGMSTAGDASSGVVAMVVVLVIANSSRCRLPDDTDFGGAIKSIASRKGKLLLLQTVRKTLIFLTGDLTCND